MGPLPSAHRWVRDSEGAQPGLLGGLHQWEAKNTQWSDWLSASPKQITEITEHILCGRVWMQDPCASQKEVSHLGKITMIRLGRLRARGGWAWRKQTRGEGQCVGEGEGPFLSELRARRVAEVPHLTSGETEVRGS